NPSLLVPQSALLIDASGVRVAVVNADGTLHYRPVQIGRDFGNDVEVLSGVETTDVLATGLAANVAEGSRVEVAKPADTGAGAAGVAADCGGRSLAAGRGYRVIYPGAHEQEWSQRRRGGKGVQPLPGGLRRELGGGRLRWEPPRGGSCRRERRGGGGRPERV